MTFDTHFLRPKDVSAENAVLPDLLPDMRMFQSQSKAMTANTGSEWLPQLPLDNSGQASAEGRQSSSTDALPKHQPEQIKEPQNLPKHEMQTDIGAGTPDRPINNNCQTTTLKNIFHFYGMDSQASKVNDLETQLLSNIRDQHGKGIDTGAIEGAFKNDHMSPSQVQSAIQAGQLNHAFTEDVTINHLSAKNHNKGTVATNETATLFLSEMGCKPEQQPLGTKEAADKVQAALDSGAPVTFLDQNTTSLHERATTPPGTTPRTIQGHVYMAYKKDGQYYVSDPLVDHAVPVSDQVLKDKLMDRNSTATIINAPPDPDKFLRH
jgi:hypothetical protein